MTSASARLSQLLSAWLLIAFSVAYELETAGLVQTLEGNPVLVHGFEAEFERAPEHPWLADASLQVVLSVCRLSVEKDLPTLLRLFVAALFLAVLRVQWRDGRRFA